MHRGLRTITIHHDAVMHHAPGRLLHALSLLALSAAQHRGCLALSHDVASNATVVDIADALANDIITATIHAEAPAVQRPVVHCHTPAPPAEVVGAALAKIARQKQHSHSTAQIESAPFVIKVAVHVLSSGASSCAGVKDPYCVRMSGPTAIECAFAGLCEHQGTGAGTLRAHGNIPDAWITAQLTQLNAAYSRSGFTFVLANVRHARTRADLIIDCCRHYLLTSMLLPAQTTRTKNAAWFGATVGSQQGARQVYVWYCCGCRSSMAVRIVWSSVCRSLPWSLAESQFKQMLGVRNPLVLNLYTGKFVAQTGGNVLLGWSSYPWDAAAHPELDGVSLLCESLPGESQRLPSRSYPVCCQCWYAVITRHIVQAAMQTTGRVPCIIEV